MKITTLLAAIVLFVSFSNLQASEWITDFDRALDAAKENSQPIFLDVFADWCSWCHKLDKEVYSDPKFKDYMKQYVLARIDAEDGGKGTSVSEKYKVESLPTMLVIDAQGKVINRLTGFMDTSEMIQELEYVSKLLAAEVKSPSAVEPSLLLATTYLERRMYGEAETRYKKVLESASATSIQKEKAQFSIALAEYYQGKLEPALKILDQYESNYRDGASGEDALLLLSQIHIEMNSNRKALQYLREFMKRYPTSGNAVRAKQVLSALEQECVDC